MRNFRALSSRVRAEINLGEKEKEKEKEICARV